MASELAQFVDKELLERFGRLCPGPFPWLISFQDRQQLCLLPHPARNDTVGYADPVR